MSQQPSPIYNITSLSSESERIPWEGIAAVAIQLSRGFVVLWQHHGVFTGQIEQGAIRWLNDYDPEPGDEHFVRLRAFNDTQEYHFWRSGQQIKGRLRSDVAGETVEVVDTCMILRGVVAKPLKKVSADWVEETLAVSTRNYVGYDPQTHQVGYVDSRFVDFKPINQQ
jgi:hypothetical protein